ncbi:Ribosomal silencing factor RsfS [Sedimentisphaera cyanobacteriorum]|uniref:Ribosomal silencing factor RsfS n=1 Tax=Sedimentisphaera cyanobacteriorum TaxID=1940790 RepID=A0A1Q2HS95_9BACT|nr:ribosome silencing factor [Sedimentisphaera cyanobacteriorum]AQQ10126.1 Ribosomal silencing factor RsfS [Sedimentisphaera cyanobacteriorum]
MIPEKEKKKAENFAVEMARLISDRHFSDVVVLDLCGQNPAVEYLVIATGTSDRQTRSVAEELVKEAKHTGFEAFGKAGCEQGRWILLDFVDVVVHLFESEFREYYDLELLWGDAKQIQWQEN